MRGGKLPSGPLSPIELAQLAIGQYGIAATPLQMAMVVQAIGNDGLMMEPILIDAVKTSGEPAASGLLGPDRWGTVIQVQKRLQDPPGHDGGSLQGYGPKRGFAGN